MLLKPALARVRGPSLCLHLTHPGELEGRLLGSTRTALQGSVVPAFILPWVTAGGPRSPLTSGLPYSGSLGALPPPSLPAPVLRPPPQGDPTTPLPALPLQLAQPDTQVPAAGDGQLLSSLPGGAQGSCVCGARLEAWGSPTPASAASLRVGYGAQGCGEVKEQRPTRQGALRLRRIKNTAAAVRR